MQEVGKRNPISFPPTPAHTSQGQFKGMGPSWEGKAKAAQILSHRIVEVPVPGSPASALVHPLPSGRPGLESLGGDPALPRDLLHVSASSPPNRCVPPSPCHPRCKPDHRLFRGATVTQGQLRGLWISHFPSQARLVPRGHSTLQTSLGKPSRRYILSA